MVTVAFNLNIIKVVVVVVIICPIVVEKVISVFLLFHVLLGASLVNPVRKKMNVSNLGKKVHQRPQGTAW
jgi:hypothetical protein